MTRWCDHKIDFELGEELANSHIFITFRQGERVVCEFSDADDAVTVDGNVVTLLMTPGDTGQFDTPFTTVQLNILTGEKRRATEIMKLPVYDNLCEKELTEVGA